MKILFLCSTGEDYLADGILHGLKTIYGADVIDYPKCEPLYKNCPTDSFKRVRGFGFTLYGLLDDLVVDRWNVLSRLKSGEFDWVVFGNIYRNYALFVDWLPFLDPKKTILLDGEDTPGIAPFAGRWWRRSSGWLTPTAHKKFRYFKREWGPVTLRYRFYKLLPENLCEGWYASMGINRVSFSIPEEKIIKDLTLKTKNFPSHIVDTELALKLKSESGSYKFTTEHEYYADIMASRFGITTKRAGWDCLRHYEIAANGAVPCFKALDDKPKTCAPHGLDSTNSISYRNADELMKKIEVLSQAQYEVLQQNAIDWARNYSTKAVAVRLLENT